MSTKRSSFRKLLPLVTTLVLMLPLLFALAAPVSAAGTIRVDGDAAGCVFGSGQGDPYGVVYCKIQDAVTDALSGDTIHVYPRTGVYDEGVDLALAGGDITLITVNNAGNPTPGTVTVDNPGDAPEFFTSGQPDANVTIDGFKLRSLYSAIDLDVDDGDVEIRNVDASGTGGDGIKVRAGAGNVTITDCTTNNNHGPGIYVWGTGGDVTITNCTANQNVCPLEKLGEPECEAPHGIAVVGVGGKVTITNCTTLGNGGRGIHVSPPVATNGEAAPSSVPSTAKVTITKCTANNNQWDGIGVFGTSGDVVITDCTANGNGDDGIIVARAFPGPRVANFVGHVTITNCTANGNEDGFDLANGIPGTATIQACIARDNRNDGVDLGAFGPAGVDLIDGVVLVNGSIICGNECGVYLSGGNTFLGNGAGMNFEGNWWGCPGGPDGGLGCDPICQYDSIPVDFTPWIKSISGSATVDPVMAGQPTIVTFQFSGGPPPVYLGEGPGDRRGPAPFTVSTDNGTLDGKGATIGAFINQPDGVLKVTLVPQRAGTARVTVQGPCGLHAFITLGTWEFVPEPGSVALLATGLVGLAGYAGLRLRKK